MRILLAIGNRFNRNIVNNLLRSFGFHEMIEVADSDAAIKALHESPPDLVVVSRSLKPRDGIKLTEAIRTDPTIPNHRLPVVMIAERALRDDVMNARDAGINEFVVAPISARGLRAHLEAAIHRQRAFIESAAYIGPDRRRHGGFYGGTERRRGRPARGR